MANPAVNAYFPENTISERHSNKALLRKMPLGFMYNLRYVLKKVPYYPRCDISRTKKSRNQSERGEWSFKWPSKHEESKNEKPQSTVIQEHIVDDANITVNLNHMGNGRLASAKRTKGRSTEMGIDSPMGLEIYRLRKESEIGYAMDTKMTRTQPTSG